MCNFTHSFFCTIFSEGGNDMDMKKLIDKLLKREDLKDVPMKFIFLVVSSVFDIMATENVFYREEL